jgi:hypothetical protein
MLDYNAASIGTEAAKRHAQRLNRCDEQSLDAEWEVAILYGLARLGSVEHEPAFGGSARLDFAFHGPTGIAFSGDVTTVTDSGVAKVNPLDHFEDELRRRAGKLGLTLAGFTMRIGGRTEATRRAEKTYLALPANRDEAIFFDKDFERFLERVAKNPTKPQAFHRTSARVDVEIAYTPGEEFFGANYPSYARAQSLTVNSLYNSLDRKADQLKSAGGTGHRVIVACDGASGSLRYQTVFGREEYSSTRIVKRFLQDHTVGAVCLVTAGRGNVEPLKVRTEVVTHSSVAPADAESIRGVFNALPAMLPPPESDALNALIHLRGPARRLGRSFIGGFKMSASRVTLSARAVQELLAGTLSHEDFKRRYGDSDPNPVTVLAGVLKTGRLIESVSVERCPDHDDDWLTFHFSKPDPAPTALKVG